MRTTFFLIVLIFSVVARSQDDKPPSKEEMQAELQQTIKEAKQQIDEIKLQIAEAKKNNDDPETIKQMEQQLVSLQQMVSMLEKTNIPGNKPPKALPPAKNTEPAYVSPFTPITLKQPVKPPTWEQATDQLLWYWGQRIDANTLITPSGMIVRYDPQRNTLTWQPDKKDTTYYGLVNTLGKIRQLKTDYSSTMESMMNSYFMFPLIEDAYKEYEFFKTRFYKLAKNTREVPEVTNYFDLDNEIYFFDHELRNLPPITAIPPPERQNDLCICADRENVRIEYENNLEIWNTDLFKEEFSILRHLEKIFAYMEFIRRSGTAVHTGAQTILEMMPHYNAKILERISTKLSRIADQYKQGDIKIEDGMVYAWSLAYKILEHLPDDNKHTNVTTFQTAKEALGSTLFRISDLVASDIFEKYIEEQKRRKNFNAVFDFGLYSSHEFNKSIVGTYTNINKNLFETWIKGLEKFNRFKLTIEIDFDYLQVNKADNDEPLLVAYGVLNSDEMMVSLGRHDCQWELYLKDVNHRNRNTTGKEFEIPMNVVAGSKDFIKDQYPPIPYTGPSIMKMVFPTFKLSFCGGGSSVMMDVLRYEPADVERHKNDDGSKKYSLDMQFFVNKLFLSAVKTKLNVNELIGTSVNMMNIQSSQLPTSSGDPALDRLKMDYLMNKNKYDLQFSLSQTSHTGKTVIPLSLDRAGSSRLFHPSVDLADPGDPDREKGMIMNKGLVTLKVEHFPR